MADPISLAAVGLTVAGTGIQAFGQYRQGVAGQAEANYKAAVARERAAYEEQAGGTQAEIKGLEYGQRIARIRAAQGASNLDVNRGTQVSVVESQRETARFDQAQIMANARERARVLRAGGVLDEFAGRNAMAAGEIGAAGTVVAGLGRAASMGMQQSTLGASTSVAPRWQTASLDFESGSAIY